MTLYVLQAARAFETFHPADQAGTEAAYQSGVTANGE
jgi:hypothetical protein